IEIANARTCDVHLENAAGLLLTGGPDIAADFLRQKVSDPALIEDAEPQRDAWEFAAVEKALARGIPVLAICKGMQVLNVALGGTLHLDVRNHRGPDLKFSNVQPLRFSDAAIQRFERVNSSHHQAVDRLGDGLEIEAWCATDDVIEQVRLRDYPFALGVQYHPERGKIYDGLFDDFIARVADVKILKR